VRTLKFNGFIWVLLDCDANLNLKFEFEWCVIKV
jgi:hypothetical protein